MWSEIHDDDNKEENNKRDFDRVVICSDFHCGHRVGITPTDWISRSAKKKMPVQQEMWDRYLGAIEQLKPIDYFIGNGYRDNFVNVKNLSEALRNLVLTRIEKGE